MQCGFMPGKGDGSRFVYSENVAGKVQQEKEETVYVLRKLGEGF